MAGTVVVAGVGPGLGYSVSRRFAEDDHTVIMLARDTEKLSDFEDNLSEAEGKVASYHCDVTDPESVGSTFATIRETYSDPSVLVYNAGKFEFGEVMEVDSDTFKECWEANCFGAYLTAQEVIPEMKKSGEGTIIFTGATAAMRGSAGFSALAVGKFGLRALAQSLAREYGSSGIHVSHVIVDGQINTPGNLEEFPERDQDSFLDSDEIAETYWNLHNQDRTAWTLEIDLRPYVEEF